MNRTPEIGSGNRFCLTRRTRVALVAMLLVLAPYLVWGSACYSQTMPPQPGDALPAAGDGNSQESLSPSAKQTEQTSQYYTDAQGQTTLVQQAAEQDKNGVIENVENLLKGEMGTYNDTYFALHQWFSDDWVSNLFGNIGQLIGKWLTEFLHGWVADTVQFLTAFLKIFVLNPNIAVNGTQQDISGQKDDISPFIRQAADVMYGIAIDLLLLLFVLCIWKFWADAAWKGGGNLMGAVGRLIFTSGILLAWPTIWAFEIQITNEMIKAIYFNSADQLVQLDAAMAAMVKGGLVTSFALLAHVFAPVVGAVAGGAIGGEAGGVILGTVGDIVSFAGLVIYTTLGVILIIEMVYLLVLKAIQTALLTAQYMFAPLFLVTFASPDTESYATGYVKAWIEVSLWTFIWIGLFKIFVVMIYSDFNPWGKILMAVGILQIMIQVPSFMARAMISPMSDLISAGLVSGLLMKGIGKLSERSGKFMEGMTNRIANNPAIFPMQAKATNLNYLPTEAADQGALQGMRAAGRGLPLPGQAGGVGGPPLKNSGGASPGGAQPLSTSGQSLQTETEEQRKQREESERQLRAQQYVAALAGHRAAAFNQAGMPGGMSAVGAAAMTGLGAAVARQLSTSGVLRGIADPTAMNMPAELQGVDAIPTAGVLSHQAANAMKDGVFNPAEGCNQTGYKHVEPKITAVNARTYNGTSIGFSDDGHNKLVGDGRGNLRHIRARKGATPEEVAHLTYAGGYTELFKDDAEASDAAREAAMAAGALDPEGLSKPSGLGQRMVAGWLGYNGGSFKQTALAKQNFNRAMFEQAALGSEAYVSGREGNAYTQYLQRRFGNWSAADDTWACHIMTDNTSPASPWNPAYSPATEALFSAGIPISELNRAASANPHVMKLPGWQRKTAIPAVARLSEQVARAMYPDAPASVIDVAAGRIAQQWSHQEVTAANAIQIESAGEDLSVPVVEAVASIAAHPRCKGPEDAYRSYRTAARLLGSGARPTAAVNYVFTGGDSGGGRIDPAGLPNFPDVEINGGGTNNVIEVEIGSPDGGSPQVQSVTVSRQGGQPMQSHAQFIQGSVSSPNRVAAAHQMVMHMYDSGFRDQHIQDPAIAQVAHHFYQQQPSMLHTVYVAAENLAPNDVSVDTVHTIEQMMAHGFDGGQISRPDIHTAALCHKANVAPTPQNVRQWRFLARNNPNMAAPPP